MCIDGLLIAMLAIGSRGVKLHKIKPIGNTECETITLNGIY